MTVSMFNDIDVDRAERIAAAGGSDYDIATAFSIDETTLLVWFCKHPQLDEAIERGRLAFKKWIARGPRPPCPRCGGFVDIVIEFTKEASISGRIPRCLMCGKRFYRGVTEVKCGESYKKRGRGRGKKGEGPSRQGCS